MLAYTRAKKNENCGIWYGEVMFVPELAGDFARRAAP
jgi:hypothetical protein